MTKPLNDKIFIGRCLCFDCGTGYGKSAPLSSYETSDNGVIHLCDECIDERVAEESYDEDQEELQE